MGFLKAILSILLVYYLFKFLIRLFAPKIIGFAAKKTERHFRERFGEFAQRGQRPMDEDNVVVQKKKTKNTTGDQKVGEYIDFEEID